MRTGEANKNTMKEATNTPPKAEKNILKRNGRSRRHQARNGPNEVDGACPLCPRGK